MSRKECNLFQEESDLSQDRVTQAYNLARKAHEGQIRRSNEPYIDHPIAVEKIIREEWGIENEILSISAFLHDTIEDTNLKLPEIEKIFGHDVAEIVDGVTKLKNDTEKETTQKVFDKLVLQPAVALIKLADRLHNMRTQKHMSPEQRIKKSQETFNTYIPLAESLGMWEVKRQIEDLCYENSDEESWENMKQSVEKDPRSKDLFQSNITSKIEQIVKDGNGSLDKISVRNESLWFINQKLNNFETNDLQAINDIISIRLVVSSKKDIYTVLGILDESKDINIDHKKCDRYLGGNEQNNGYKALQTTILCDQGPVEIAIVTKEIEDFNKEGIVNELKKGKKFSELTKYFLKPVFVHGVKARFVPRQATIADIIQNSKKLIYAKSANVDGEECPLSTIPPSNSTISINYGEEPYAVPLEDLKWYCLPETRQSIENLQRQQKTEKIINQGKAKIREILSSRGLLSLIYLRKNAESKYRELINEFGESEEKLYHSLGKGYIKEEELNKVLDGLFITKKELNVTTIEIDGENKPHILSKILEQIDNTISIDESLVDSNKNFHIRLVVEDLTKEQLIEELKIRDDLIKLFSEQVIKLEKLLDINN
jgi:(p)ppGpp synthase/HD superfamily hydrolase